MFFGKILEEEIVPDAWKRRRKTLIDIKNEKQKDNFEKYIAEMSVIAEFFGIIINKKLKQWVEKIKCLVKNTWN